jgi:hypothetical protein
MKILNFDKAATTTLTPRVKKAMKQALKYEGNPSVNCIEGNKARDIIESSRATIAKILNTSEDNIFFTSGGTEGNNQALMSMAIEGIKQNKKHIIVSAIEHHAVLEMAEWLSEYMGFTISYVQPSKNCNFGWGAIDVEQIKSLITPQTIGVSVMCVNNETGIINDITWIAKMCSNHNLLLHVDAVQSISADGRRSSFVRLQSLLSTDDAAWAAQQEDCQKEKRNRILPPSRRMPHNLRTENSKKNAADYGADERSSPANDSGNNSQHDRRHADVRIKTQIVCIEDAGGSTEKSRYAKSKCAQVISIIAKEFHLHGIVGKPSETQPKSRVSQPGKEYRHKSNRHKQCRNLRVSHHKLTDAPHTAYASLEHLRVVAPYQCNNLNKNHVDPKTRNHVCAH